MYHYTECGLPNVYLKNGFTESKSPYGKLVTFHDIKGLHVLIGNTIVMKPGRLDSTEIRFIRKELGLSQLALAKLIGVKEITYRTWEGNKQINVTADRLLRTLYKEFIDKNPDAYALVTLLADLDSKVQKARIELSVEKRSNSWKLESKVGGYAVVE